MRYMGVNLTPIIKKTVVNLSDLSGKTLACDANNILYQFLALIRTHKGHPLTDRKGRITSHLVGLTLRATKLLDDHSIKLVYVFDGKPPELKKKELKKRRKTKEKAKKEMEKALKSKDFATAYSKATMTSRLTTDMIKDTKKLLTLLGIPFVQAPSEAEAQAAYMTKDVYGAASRDYDTLLFGAVRQIRYVTIRGREYLPSKGVSRKYEPEIIDLQKFLNHLGITRKQLVDMSIVMGNDFSPGIKGIGPKRGLKLIKEHKKLENMPDLIQNKIPPEYDAIRDIFLNPPVTDEYSIEYEKFDRDALINFLQKRQFSQKHITTVLTRMESFSQETLERWL